MHEELKNQQNIDNIIIDEDIINDKEIENHEDINIIKEDKLEEDNIVVPNEKVDVLNELNENLYEEDIKHLYSKEEIERILERFKDNSPFTCAFLTSCFTGTRTREVFALTCNDIDFENGIINIKHNVYDKVDDGRGRWYIGTTKTETGTRHRTAERVAKQTNEIVICISQRRGIITIFKGDFRYVIKEIT